MRIIKYLFLLILLALVALTVFVATQKGEFQISRSRLIKSPLPVVFNYVNDYKNWENWSALKDQDPETVFSFKEVTSGRGASFSWTSSDSDGKSTTTYVKENDSIVQKVMSEGNNSDVFWKFKDTVGGTKVTWTTRGQLGFKDKIYAALKGGTDKSIGQLFEKGLANLDNNLDFEINTFTVSAGGVVERPAVMYLKQTINSKISDHPRNLRIMMSKMHRFFTKNKITSGGKLFVIYHTYDTAIGITKFSVCMPVSEEIFISPGSDTQFGKLEAMRATKATLKGDYSHRTKAWQKAFDIVSTERLERNPTIRLLEVFTAGPETVKRPSQWVTEVYVPLKAVAVRDTTRVIRRVQPVAVPVQPTQEIQVP